MPDCSAGSEKLGVSVKWDERKRLFVLQFRGAGNNEGVVIRKERKIQVEGLGRISYLLATLGYIGNMQTTTS